MPITLKIHERFSTILRDLSDDERERLKVSIEAEGCREPIQTWNGYIIDGHNRYEICHETNQSFQTADRTADFEAETDVIIWMRETALARRNLTASEFREQVGELYNALKLRDKTVNLSSADKMALWGDTAQKVGEKFGVSARSVKRYGSEAERQKLLKELQIEVQKEAIAAGRGDDEEWQQDRLNEVSEQIEPVDDAVDEPSSDEYSQVEPTQEQKVEIKKKKGIVKNPPGKAEKLRRECKNALKGYATALSKIQGLRLELLFADVVEPDYKTLHAWIEAETAKIEPAKKRFGR